MSVGIQTGNVLSAYVLQVTVDLANVATITSNETTVSVPGVKPTDLIIANKPSLETGITIGNVRAGTDQIFIQAVNPTVAGVNATAETYTICVLRPESVVTGIAD